MKLQPIEVTFIVVAIISAITWAWSEYKNKKESHE